MNIINHDEHNESTVVELLVGFFEYYSYKYTHYIISISRHSSSDLLLRMI